MSPRTRSRRSSARQARARRRCSRAINRLHDETKGAVVTGSIRLGDVDIYNGGIPATLLRTRVGMVFQRPNPFPTMSIYDNVVSGLRFNGIRKKSVLEEAAESALDRRGFVGLGLEPDEGARIDAFRG